MALPKILETVNNKVVLNETILSIPEFKQVWDDYQDLQIFQYLWAMYDPESPYMNLDEDDRASEVLKDFPVQRYLNDFNVIECEKKCEKLYFSAVRKILMGTKSGIEKLVNYFETSEIVAGRDGNITAFVNSIKSMSQLIKSYQEAENAYMQEVRKNRGNVQEAVDEDLIFDYD